MGESAKGRKRLGLLSRIKGGLLKRYAQRDSDFRPSLASEYLEKDGLRVDHETLRRWLLEPGGRSPGARSIGSTGNAGHLAESGG